MRRVFIGHDSVVTSLGRTTEENYAAIFSGRSGIAVEEFHGITATTARIDQSMIDAACASQKIDNTHTRLEKLFILSITDVLSRSSVDPENPRTALVISTTKGNVGELSRRGDPHSRVNLIDMAHHIAAYFGFKSSPHVVSNACVSGLSAIAYARALISAGVCDAAVVSGGDVITDFVLSGFLSFRAISDEPCAPFDAGRKGLSLGEGCATIVLSSDRMIAAGLCPVEIIGSASSNDANHISGPSRDGGGLLLSVEKAMNEAKITAGGVHSISAHGTGTVYNDEMESKAFYRAALGDVPLYSLKGYVGHTLGAAGVIESVIAVNSVRRNEIVASCGFVTSGVPMSINVCRKSGAMRNDVCLKTASGFGGCNAAILFAKGER